MILALPLAALAALTPPERPAPDPRHTLMPVPASLPWGEGRLRLDPSFAGTSPGGPGDAALPRAVTRFLTRLGLAPGIPVAWGRAGLALAVKGPGEAVQS